MKVTLGVRVSLLSPNDIRLVVNGHCPQPYLARVADSLNNYVNKPSSGLGDFNVPKVDHLENGQML